MRIALVGIGKIANYQMQAITHTPGITLVDAHDLDEIKAEVEREAGILKARVKLAEQEKAQQKANT